MADIMTPPTRDREDAAPRDTLRAYAQPRLGRSLWELAITAVPFAVLWTLVFLSVRQGWWWGLVLAVPGAAFLVRLFMIQHDCGHHALFRSVAANTWLGRGLGVLTLTPYDYWRRTHAIHHATSGHLDRRGLGAIEILTVAEYRALPPLRRLAYRAYRHPVTLLGLGPAYMFLLQHRLPIGVMREGWAWRSVMGVNLALAAVAAAFALAGELPAFLITQASVVVLAGTFGIWLFYVQHQFDTAYWARGPQWLWSDAAVKGSSHLVLPAPLAWMTANIGIHHVHHLASRIPFYRLPEVLAREPGLRDARQLTWRDGLAALKLSIWDEQAARLVPFSAIPRAGALGPSA